MTRMTERIWYGSAQTRDDRLELARPATLALIILALVAGRLLLPFHDHESMMVYEEIAWALEQHRVWGRQALVGLLDYPPLPIVSLMVLTPLAALTRIPVGHLLVAICQVWTLTYLVRLAGLYPSRKLRFVLGGLLFGLLLLGPSATETNPFWIQLVVLSSILFHLCRWERHQSLRDLVVIALNCGVLIFAGVVGILFSLTILVTVWLRGDPEFIRRQGGTTLLVLPVSYSLMLYPLFNWLIMGDPFFWLKRFFESFNQAHILDNIQYIQPRELHMLLALAAISVIIMLLPRVPLYVRLGYNLTVAAGFCAALRSGAEIFLGGEYLMVGFVGIPLLAFFLYQGESRLPNVTSTVGIMGLNILFLAACVQYRGSAKAGEHFAANPAPPPAAEILQLVDEYWDRSRVLTYDLRTAVLYTSQEPDRFWSRLDYNESYLRELIREEQFHLLIPPNNGKFYSRFASPLSVIHEKGRRWLFLEKEWPGGWQLWRCIRPRPVASDDAEQADL